MVAEKSSMIDFDEALELVLSNANQLSTEIVAIEHLLGRNLAKPVFSICDLPLFDNSAVDGYALTASDIETGIRGASFELVGEMRAGCTGSVELSNGQVARVFTGAPVPIGTGGVAMQEIATTNGTTVRFGEEIEVGNHVRMRGEEVRIGEVLVGCGVVNPATIGALAAGGIREAEVYRQPVIGILVSGDELASEGTEPEPGQIFESNGESLSAAVQSMGFSKPRIVRCPDDLHVTVAALSDLIDQSDLVITTGGVSVGDHDVLRPAFDRLGVRQVFWSVAIKPGKPLYFGRTDRCAVFGLPGNPVSALTTYYLFVKPYLNKVSGQASTRSRRSMTLMADLEKKPGRTEFVPCRIGSIGAHPMVGRASHKASCLSDANGFIILEKESEFMRAGSIVDVMEVIWGLDA